jgi:hypothetical protein
MHETNTSVLFQQEIARQLTRLAQKPRINSYHEAYGLLQEEVDEFWDEVRKKSCRRNHANSLKELAQIAALTMRIATDLKLSYASIFDFAAKFSTSDCRAKKAANI